MEVVNKLKKFKLSKELMNGILCVGIVVCLLAGYVVSTQTDLITPDTSFELNVVDAWGGTTDEDQAADYSFYMLASSASGALSSALADTKDGPSTKISAAFGTMSSATAGGIVAYSDADTKGILGMFLNLISMSSATKNYKSFVDIPGQESTGRPGSDFTHHIIMGVTLNELGLDQTGSAVETIGALSSRMVIGTIVEFMYYISQSVSVAFRIVIDLLKAINPFQAFKTIGTADIQNVDETLVQNLSAENKYVSHLTQIGTTNGNAIWSAIQSFVTTLYGPLYSLGKFMMLLYFLWLLYKMFFPGRTSRASHMKSWVTRALFLFGGITLLGTTYTTTLDYIAQCTTGANSAAAKIIASTFADFEGWTMAGMPGLYIKYSRNSGGEFHATGANNVQNLCFLMNVQTAKGNPIFGSDTSFNLGSSSTPNVSTVTGLVNTLQTRTAAGSTDSDSVSDWCMDVIRRYKLGTKITSSDYESAWKATHWNGLSTAEAKTLKDFIEMSDSSSDVLSNLNDVRFDKTKPLYGTSNQVYNPFTCDGATVNYITGGIPSPIGAVDGWHDALEGAVASDSTKSAARVSAMSIYNYLNTTFDSTALTIYSSSLSASNYIRDSHYSVNLVGNGIQSTIILITCVLLLGSYTIMGFYYSLGMIMNNIKRGFRMIMAVPGATLGSIAAIAKVVSYTVLMIVEIVANILLYCLMTEIIYTVATAITTMVGSILTTTETSHWGTGFGAEIIKFAAGLFVIVFLIWFTIMSIRLRKPVVKMFEEMADNVVQKFIVGGTASNNLGAAQANVGGTVAAAGAGAAAGAMAGSRGAQAAQGGGGGGAAAGLMGLTTPGMVAGNLSKSKQKAEMRKAKQEAGAMALVSNLGFSSQSSAVKDEENRDNLAEAKKAARKQERKEKATAGLKTVVGAAEVAAGAATGNVAIAAQGVKNMAGGLQGTQQAEMNKLNNDAAALAAYNTQSGGAVQNKKSIAHNANARNKAVQGIDVKQEAMALAGAGIGGAAAGGAGAAANTANLGAAAGGTQAVSTAASGASNASNLATTAKKLSDSGVQDIIGGDNKLLPTGTDAAQPAEVNTAEQLTKKKEVKALASNSGNATDETQGTSQTTANGGKSADATADTKSKEAKAAEADSKGNSAVEAVNSESGDTGSKSAQSATSETESTAKQTEKVKIDKEIETEVNESGDSSVKADVTKSVQAESIETTAQALHKTVVESKDETEVRESGDSAVPTTSTAQAPASTETTAETTQSKKVFARQVAEYMVKDELGLNAPQGGNNNGGGATTVETETETVTKKKNLNVQSEVNVVESGSGDDGSAAFVGSSSKNASLSEEETVARTKTRVTTTQTNNSSNNSGNDSSAEAPMAVSGSQHVMSVDDMTTILRNNKVDERIIAQVSAGASSNIPTVNPQSMQNTVQVKDVTRVLREAGIEETVITSAISNGSMPTMNVQGREESVNVQDVMRVMRERKVDETVIVSAIANGSMPTADVHGNSEFVNVEDAINILRTQNVNQQVISQVAASAGIDLSAIPQGQNVNDTVTDTLNINRNIQTNETINMSGSNANTNSVPQMNANGRVYVQNVVDTLVRNNQVLVQDGAVNMSQVSSGSVMAQFADSQEMVGTCTKTLVATQNIKQVIQDGATTVEDRTSVGGATNFVDTTELRGSITKTITTLQDVRQQLLDGARSEENLTSAGGATSFADSESVQGHVQKIDKYIQDYQAILESGSMSEVDATGNVSAAHFVDTTEYGGMVTKTIEVTQAVEAVLMTGSDNTPSIASEMSTKH